jgi:hypothetical protein
MKTERKRKQTNLAMAVEERNSTGGHQQNGEDDRDRTTVNPSRFHQAESVVFLEFLPCTPSATRSAGFVSRKPYSSFAPRYAYTVGIPTSIRRVLFPM